jgi:hypothetical protein
VFAEKTNRLSFLEAIGSLMFVLDGTDEGQPMGETQLTAALRDADLS